ncbi:MAG: DUF1320 domain-containing protein [Deltaproteobacteria bacterium]|nr:DUF1320 domain-containing protein [Deltaproteobacteria bacterium]
MAYCTKEDILDKLDEESLIQLTDDEGTGTVNDGRVDKAIAAADATINFYCRNLYLVPLSPAPDKINQIAVNIAIYELYSRRDDTMPDTRKDKYNGDIRTLEKVSDGKIKLPCQASASTAEGEHSGELMVSTRSKQFGPDTVDKY